MVGYWLYESSEEKEICLGRFGDRGPREHKGRRWEGLPGRWNSMRKAHNGRKQECLGELKGSGAMRGWWEMRLG